MPPLSTSYTLSKPLVCLLCAHSRLEHIEIHSNEYTHVRFLAALLQLIEKHHCYMTKLFYSDVIEF
jgi:hypothetical protein